MISLQAGSSSAVRERSETHTPFHIWDVLIKGMVFYRYLLR